MRRRIQRRIPIVCLTSEPSVLTFFQSDVSRKNNTRKRMAGFPGRQKSGRAARPVKRRMAAQEREQDKGEKYGSHHRNRSRDVELRRRSHGRRQAGYHPL